MMGWVDADIKKDVLFWDKIMHVVETEETSPLFTPFVLRLKQICKQGRDSVRKRSKLTKMSKGEFSRLPKKKKMMVVTVIVI